MMCGDQTRHAFSHVAHNHLRRREEQKTRGLSRKLQHPVVRSLGEQDMKICIKFGKRGRGIDGAFGPLDILRDLGDVIIGDVDGVVVVKREHAEAVSYLGQKRIEKEKMSRAMLRAGELGVDFYGLRAKLKELGVEYVDE